MRSLAASAEPVRRVDSRQCFGGHAKPSSSGATVTAALEVPGAPSFPYRRGAGAQCKFWPRGRHFDKSPGAKQRSTRAGNRLTTEQDQDLTSLPDPEMLKEAQSRRADPVSLSVPSEAVGPRDNCDWPTPRTSRPGRLSFDRALGITTAGCYARSTAAARSGANLFSLRAILALVIAYGRKIGFEKLPHLRQVLPCRACVLSDACPRAKQNAKRISAAILIKAQIACGKFNSGARRVFQRLRFSRLNPFRLPLFFLNTIFVVLPEPE